MSNIINIKILIGIPCSGKSTWAKNYVLNNRKVARINRDELREMMMASVITNGNNNFINKIKKDIIYAAIKSNRNLVIDDTHCYVKQLVELIDYIRCISMKLNKNIFIEVIDFDIDVDICIERNKYRDIKIPVKGIYFMFNSKKEINFSELRIDKYERIDK